MLSKKTSVKRVSHLQPEKENSSMCLNTTSLLGQKEQFIDPNDSKKPPAYSKLIGNFSNDREFFSSNIKTLLGTSNEYYSYLGGKCLCGSCVCGSCKCVHFRKAVGDPHPLSIQKSDFTPQAFQPVKRKIKSPEIKKLTAPFTDTSIYRLDFNPRHGRKISEPTFYFRSKCDSLGPSALNMKAPFSMETTNKLSLIDWGTSKTSPFNPIMSQLGHFHLPLGGKLESREMGRYFKDGVRPDFVKAPNPSHEEKSNFLTSSIPQNLVTNYKKDFSEIPDILKSVVERKVREGNLTTEKSAFDGNYQPISADFSAPNKVFTCPMAEQIVVLKKQLRDYAITNKIPF